MYATRIENLLTRIEFLIIRVLLLALLLIAAYRILDNEIHISRLVSELMSIK